PVVDVGAWGHPGGVPCEVCPPLSRRQRPVELAAAQTVRAEVERRPEREDHMSHRTERGSDDARAGGREPRDAPPNDGPHGPRPAPGSEERPPPGGWVADEPP